MKSYDALMEVNSRDMERNNLIVPRAFQTPFVGLLSILGANINDRMVRDLEASSSMNVGCRKRACVSEEEEAQRRQDRCLHVRVFGCRRSELLLRFG